MNIAFDEWIPCVGRNGVPRAASLLACLTDEEIADVAVMPHERIALMRLFVCVAHAAVGIPDDETAWKACREGMSEAISRYLEKWKDAFELFHPERPFLQAAGLRTETASPAARLDCTLTSGNNAAFFDAGMERAAPARAALDLLTFQAMATSGLVGAAEWNGHASGTAAKDAPCSAGSMLHVFLRDASLPKTVWLNMPSRDCLGDYEALGDGWEGVPVWEMPPKNQEDHVAAKNATRTYLGRLAAMSRAVLFLDDGKSVAIADGLSYPSFSNERDPFPPEPSAVVRIARDRDGAEKRVLVKASTSKAIWRELPAMSARRLAGGAGGCLALAHADGEKGVDIVACGMAHKQSAIHDVIESALHVLPAMLNDDGREACAAEIANAEAVEYAALAPALECRRAACDGGWRQRLKSAGAGKSELRARLRADAARTYWTGVEQDVGLLTDAIEALGTDAFQERLGAWREAVFSNAAKAYSGVCGMNGVRGMRAFVAGRNILFGRMNRIFKGGE